MNLLPLSPVPVQPVPALVPTDEKTPGAGTTYLPFELVDTAEDRPEIPLILDATGSVLTVEPVQLAPDLEPTVEKIPGAGTTDLPAPLHNRSEGRDSIPAALNPAQKPLPPPVGVLSIAKTTVAPDETNTYTVTLNRHPSQKVITIILQYGYMDFETYGDGYANQSVRGNLNSPVSTVFTMRSGGGDPESNDFRYRVRVVYKNSGSDVTFYSDSQPIIVHVVQP